jgi:hypothetical protein
VTTRHDQLVQELREFLRARADRLDLDPESINTPTPTAITSRTANGDLVRLDVSTYKSAELSL